MLYVLSGHRFWARRKLERLLAEAREKGRIIAHFPSDGSRHTAELLSQDLFGGKRCVWGENMFVEKARAQELLEALPRLVASSDIFIFVEEEMPARLGGELKKAGAKVEEVKNPSPAKLYAWAEEEAKKLDLRLSESQLKRVIEEAAGDPWAMKAALVRVASGGEAGRKSAPSGGEPNYFDFADAASAKSRGQAIKLLSEYMRGGYGAEEAFWKLWWKIKTLRMVETGAKNAGIHQFVERKAREDLRKWRTEELEEYSRSLCDLFSEVRRGERDFEEGLLALLVR